MKKSIEGVDNKRWIIGVDEAGRGPLAGPVTVAAFMAPASARAKLIKILGGKVRDSKQLSPGRRTAIYRSIWQLRKSGEVNFKVAHIGVGTIDKIGISKSIQKGVNNCLARLCHTFEIEEEYSHSFKHSVVIRLDGLLKASEEYELQKTIIRGDEKDVFVACSSIVAKVCRDALMRHLAKEYPQYKFEWHKGYGTKGHRAMIKRHGLSKIHRVTFCKLT